MKVDVVEKLEQNRSSSKMTVNRIENEVGLLMAPDMSAEREALRKAGLTMHSQEVERAVGSEIERQKLEDHYGSKVFKAEEIKDLCVKYDLRLLRASDFAGKIDGEVAKKLAAFVDAHKNEIGNYSAESFYILAPGSSFKLEDRPVKVRNVDPVLLYKPRSGDGYVFVHKWGQDFTAWRRLRGFFFESLGNMWTVSFSFYFVLISAVYAYVSGTFTGAPGQHLHFLWIAAASVGATIATLGIMFLDMEDWDERTTEYTWNSKRKRR